MAALSAACLRDEARGILLGCGLRGFVRIAAPGEALLVTDALRRAGEGNRVSALCALQKAGFEGRNEWGLLWLSPDAARLREIARRAEEPARALRMPGGDGALAEAVSFALRLMRSAASEGEWSRRGSSLLLEALRLPDPGRTGWPEAERLRAPAAVMLREQDRSCLHEAGCVLAARLTMTAAS